MKLTKEELLGLAERFAHLPGTLLLFSGGACSAATQSILALFPYDVIEVRGRTLYRNGVARSGDVWDAWQSEMGEMNLSGNPEWVGFLGYELGASADREKAIHLAEASTPGLYLQRSAVTIVVDHRSGEAKIITAGEPDEMEGGTWCDGDLTIRHPLLSREQYTEKIAWVREQILSGEIYQMCLSQEIEFAGRRDPYSLFVDLTRRNPAPFSAYLNVGPFAIVSSSPERFLSHRAGRLESRPIKGTAPRGATAAKDEARRQALLASEKERAELMMITDLVRNDLGRVSVAGTVEVEELRRCEAYANVFHTLSVIASKAKPGLHPVEIVRACFPAGSITGCPKLRAMELIHEIEGRARGPYCGAIGYFCGNGDFDLSVAIRILECYPDRIRCQLGGAIVANSEPEAEYAETLHKGESLFQSLRVAV